MKDVKITTFNFIFFDEQTASQDWIVTYSSVLQLSYKDIIHTLHYRGGCCCDLVLDKQKLSLLVIH